MLSDTWCGAIFTMLKVNLGFLLKHIKSCHVAFFLNHLDRILDRVLIVKDLGVKWNAMQGRF